MGKNMEKEYIIMKIFLIIMVIGKMIFVKEKEFTKLKHIPIMETSKIINLMELG